MLEKYFSENCLYTQDKHMCQIFQYRADHNALTFFWDDSLYVLIFTQKI